MPHPIVVHCDICDTYLISNYQHDFKTCGCYNQTMVDGGREYLRYGGKDMLSITLLKMTEVKYKRGKKRRKK